MWDQQTEVKSHAILHFIIEMQMHSYYQLNLNQEAHLEVPNTSYTFYEKLHIFDLWLPKRQNMYHRTQSGWSPLSSPSV